MEWREIRFFGTFLLVGALAGGIFGFLTGLFWQGPLLGVGFSTMVFVLFLLFGGMNQDLDDGAQSSPVRNGGDARKEQEMSVLERLKWLVVIYFGVLR